MKLFKKIKKLLSNKSKQGKSIMHGLPHKKGGTLIEAEPGRMELTNVDPEYIDLLIKLNEQA